MVLSQNSIMFTRILLVAFALEQTAAVRFQPIDWEKLEHIEHAPVHLEMKTFTEDGLDVTGAIMREGEKDAAEMDADRIAMDKEFKRIRNSYENGPEIKLHDLVKYTPKVKKMDISL